MDVGVELGQGVLKTELTKELLPSELIIVPLHATLGELKQAVETAFRDTYCMMEEFVVTDIEGTEGMGVWCDGVWFRRLGERIWNSI